MTPRENFGAGTDTIRDYALGMNSGNGPITRKDYIDIYLFAGYDLDVASSLGTKHYKTGMGQDQNTQGFAAGGVVSREKFGLGSKLKSFVRKIIPNEVAEIAVKAAPFVAPFNPALAAGMSGLGTFDKTGSIGDSLKAGGLNYAGGQAARYIGGAGFQGNPFQGGLDGTLQNFTSFSSPIGNQTGLGKFFSNRGTGEVQAVEGITADAAPVKSGGANVTESFVTADAAPVKSSINTGIDMATGGADGVGIIQDTVLNKTVVTQDNPSFLKDLFDGVSNQDYGKIAKTIGDSAKKFGKAMFTNKDGSIDKAAVMGAVAFAGSYVEALALANEAGIELTEDEYNEAVKEEKREEYAGYLTNFFGGRAEGGRIGFESGSSWIKKKTEDSGITTLEDLLEDMEDEDDDEDDDIEWIKKKPSWIKKKDPEPESTEWITKKKKWITKKADGGRINYKDGTEYPDYSDNAFLKLVDKISPLFVDEDGDFRSGLQKAKFALSEFIAGKGTDLDTGAEWWNKLDDETQKEIMLEKIKYRDQGYIGGTPLYDEEFAGRYGIGGNYADGGRIGLKFGTKPEEAEIGIMSIDVEAGDDEDDMDDLMAGITFSSKEKSYLFRKLAGQGGSDRSYTMPNLYRILSNPNRYPSDAAILKEIAIMGMKKDGGRIMYASGANRVSELLILRDGILAKDANADVSDIEAEIFQLTGKVFKSTGGIGDVPTGQIRQNSVGVIERDYRDEGGFVPVGVKERADDVPAMLSKNEFVMTADAVRGIGGGDVEKGSKKLYNTMKQAEKVGRA